MYFASPWWLLSLVLVALVLAGYVVLQLRRQKYTARFSNTALLASIAPRRPGWRRHLTFALFLLALTVLSLGVARPAASVQVPRDRATVMMAIDVSESMQATDVLPSRIEAVQRAAIRFADLLPPHINLGLVKFGGAASVLVPPTADRAQIKSAITNLRLESSTAIGEAVFTSLDAINVFSATTTAQGDKPPPARIVLMSDGANNRGRSVASAEVAANAAAVPVSTIAFGTDNGTVDIGGQAIAVPADKATLHDLATTTGGTFHTAASAQELAQVFANIGSQIGYTSTRRDISWRFTAAGLLLALAAGSASLLWGGRLV